MADPVAVAPPGDPERYLVVARLEDAASAEGRYLLVRGAEDQPPELLSVRSAGLREPALAAVRDALQMRLGLRVLGEPEVGDERVPVREAQRRAGRAGPGWLRAVAVRVEGDPLPQPPLSEVVLLPLEEAANALATSAERALLQAGAALLEADAEREP